VPTYDTLGAYFPTGDHHGLTIDYAFGRDTDTLLAQTQRPVELNSDHDAVVGGWNWQADLRSQSRVVTNDPDGDSTRRRAVARALATGIRSAEPRSLVALATTRLGLHGVVRQLKRAIDRGVRVHVVAAGDRPTTPERRLRRHMATVGNPHNWLKRCRSTCRDSYDQAGVPRGLLMLSDADRVWRTRYTSSLRFSRVLIRQSSRVRISIGEVALREAAALFHAVD
jgi:hypothetical protein